MAIIDTPSPALTPVLRLRCSCCGGWFEGRQFANQDTGYGLGNCCVRYIRERVEDVEGTYGFPGVHYQLDPLIAVQSAHAPQGPDHWRIAQNLTDRWGEINTAEAGTKPLDLLQTTSGLLDRLREQMWAEDSFVVRKDGQFGILFETEYLSLETDGEGSPPRERVVGDLLSGMGALVHRFPGVQFAVPDSTVVYKGRPAAWAFVPDGLLDASERSELGIALGSL